MFATYFDDPHRITSEIDRYVGQAPEDLARVARDRLTPDKSVTVRVVPR
jgi:hypothetical protein